MNSLYSVITVCKNSEITIAQTINSVLNQTYSNFELIIVDGLSSDSTPEIINSFKDKRIKLLREKDSGIYNAMNKGVSLSSGEIFSILNSDDFYLPNALESVNRVFLHDRNLAILCSDVYCIMRDKSLRILEAKIEGLKNEMVPHPGVFIRKSVQNIDYLFKENLRIAADYDVLLRNYAKGVKMERFKTPIAFYSEGGFSDSPANRIWSAYETFVVQHSHFPKEFCHQMIRFLWNIIGTIVKRDHKLKMLQTSLIILRSRRLF